LQFVTGTETLTLHQPTRGKVKGEKMVENNAADQIALEYGFKWFEFHAQQRTTTFNFYLVMYSGLAAAASFFLKEKLQFGSIVTSITMVGVSVLFWQLDVRNRQLIDIGERILSDSWQKNGLREDLNPIFLSKARQPVGSDIDNCSGRCLLWVEWLALERSFTRWL
jgi:hypothetical protein